MVSEGVHDDSMWRLMSTVFNSPLTTLECFLFVNKMVVTYRHIFLEKMDVAGCLIKLENICLFAETLVSAQLAH